MLKRCSSLYVLLFLASCTVSQPATPISPSSDSLPVDEAAQPPESSPRITPEITIKPTSLELDETTLWSMLAQADERSYVVLLRHALAPGTGDPANFQLNDCSTQRNLSEEGQQQAKAMGESLKRRNIPVAQVLSSQWCRCLETAELMDVGPVEPFPPINSFFQDRSTAKAQTDQLKDYIATSRDSPGVIVMVTHQVNITALTDIFPQSGSAIVLQLNDNQLEILGQIVDPTI